MDQKPKIELEELLKLKKLEKPEPEFWDKFDQGLRRKSMEALVKDDVSFWQRLWERRGLQQMAIAAAFVFCAVPTFMGVQSYYAENEAAENSSYQLAHASAMGQTTSPEDSQLIAATTRELALRKQKADNMRFVVDSYAVDPTEFAFDGDDMQVGEAAWKKSNRTYISERVKLLPEDSDILPVNLVY